MQSALWIQQLIQNIRKQQTDKVIDLLQPNIQIKGKESFNPDRLSDDMLYHLRANFQNDAEQNAFNRFALGFLAHSRLIDLLASGKQMGKQGITIKNQIFQHFQSAFTGFEQICDMPFIDGKWIGLVVDHLCKLITNYGIEADQEYLNSKEAQEILNANGTYKSIHACQEAALSAMESLFRRLQQCNNQAPDNRKFADFFISLRLIKLQFKLNNFKNTERFFKWIDTQAQPSIGYNMNMFPEKFRVMLSFFKGRYYLYKNEFSNARNELRQAFSNCHTDYPKNKKKILKFLIPVEMNLNKFPSKLLLQKYQLNEFIPLAESCIQGDLKKFEETIEQYMDTYVMSGVFLAVEKLRHLTIRNLIKKVALAIAKEPELQEGFEDKPHIILIENIYHIMNQWDQELDLDELECILANQIYLGYLKGYIMHDKRILVLGKKSDPFPLKVE
eukprot:403372576